MSHVVNLDPQAFADFTGQSEQLALVDFWASWCGPCKALLPVLDELSSEFSGRVRFGKVDVDEHPGKAQEFQVRGIPALVLFRNGEPIANLVGLQSREFLRGWLNKAIESK